MKAHIIWLIMELSCRGLHPHVYHEGETYNTCGYIGRSTGNHKIPLLVNNSRSHGGGALTDSIVKISLAKGGKVLWQHKTYQPCTTN